MISMGILRPVDRNGRIVIPKELRKQLDIKDEVDSIEIFTDGDVIVLRKYKPTCIFCKESANVFQMNGQKVCLKCIDRLNEMKNSL